MKVVVSRAVVEYLNNLIHILYNEGYFGFRDTAKRYVDDLLDDILETLPTRLSKPAPLYFERYGKEMEYTVFRKNRQTHWYVFFSTYEENGGLTYLVRYIGNNHTIAQYL